LKIENDPTSLVAMSLVFFHEVTFRYGMGKEGNAGCGGQFTFIPFTRAALGGLVGDKVKRYGDKEKLRSLLGLEPR
jgi:hypothetical protein